VKDRLEQTSTVFVVGYESGADIVHRPHVQCVTILNNSAMLFKYPYRAVLSVTEGFIVAP
jgi:hypothetical protein